MLRHFLLATVLVTAVFGVATARSVEGIEWHAVLSSLPSEACVQSAVSHTNGLSLSASKHDGGEPFTWGESRDHYYILIADLNMLVRTTDMGIHINSGRHRTIRLSLNYTPQYETIKDAAAKALFENMAASCALPDLLQRVKKEHHTSWDPNFLPAF